MYRRPQTPHAFKVELLFRVTITYYYVYLIMELSKKLKRPSIPALRIHKARKIAPPQSSSRPTRLSLKNLISQRFHIKNRHPKKKVATELAKPLTCRKAAIHKSKASKGLLRKNIRGDGSPRVLIPLRNRINEYCEPEVVFQGIYNLNPFYQFLDEARMNVNLRINPDQPLGTSQESSLSAGFTFSSIDSIHEPVQKIRCNYIDDSLDELINKLDK